MAEAYKDCATALTAVHLRCGAPGGRGYTKCLQTLNVHVNAKECDRCDVVSECRQQGTSQSFYTCLTDNSREPQVVPVGYFHGNPSRVVMEQPRS